VEWIALVCVLALALAGAGAGAWRLAATLGRSATPRAALGRSAIPNGDLRSPNALRTAYGAETAALVRRVVPGLVYEHGLRERPVDPRVCRVRTCAEGGGPVTLFTHVVRRGGTTYVQLWEYFPDSSWNGIAGRHADDWESVQLRVNPDGTVDGRASAHHGYTGRRYGPDLTLAQVEPGWVPARWRRGWTRSTGWLRIGNHSHAGYLTSGPHGRRFTPADAIVLVPLETAAGMPQVYAISPPWRKAVYADPESPRT
jgi:hypothetical protein